MLGVKDLKASLDFYTRVLGLTIKMQSPVLAVAILLLLEKLWAYPVAFAILALFIVLQLYRFTHVHDPGLIFFSILDLIVIALAAHEYQLLRKHLPTH